MKYLLPTFIILPVLEMYVLIKVGGSIGAFNTILLVLLTAFMGLYLLRLQGFQTLMNVKNKLEKSELPTGEIVIGIFLAIGGALLLTPGFITDIIGFLCLLPITRTIIVSSFFPNIASFGSSTKNKSPIKDDWIEGEFDKDK